MSVLVQVCTWVRYSFRGILSTPNTSGISSINYLLIKGWVFWRCGVRGILYIIERRLLTLCVWRAKASHTFEQIKVRNKVTIAPTGMIVYARPVVSIQAATSYRRRFHCCLFDFGDSAKVLARRWAIAKSALSLLYIASQTADTTLIIIIYKTDAAMGYNSQQTKLWGNYFS